MSILKNKISILVLFVFIGVSLMAQSTSPYSRFGLGYLRSQTFSSNKALGEISGGYRSGVGLNIVNPASYSELAFTTLEMGANVDISDLKTKDSTYRGAFGTINHIAFGMPLKRDRWGLSFGLLPFATPNYNFINQATDTFSSYKGKGSLYKVYVGTGYRIGGFSLGINFGYLFGGQDYSKGYQFPDSLNMLNVRSTTNMRVSGFLYDLGLQYKIRLVKRSEANRFKSDVNFVIGAFGNSGLKVNARNSGVTQRYFVRDGFDIVVDTTSLKTEVKDKVSLPYTVGGGFTVGNELWWIIGADFKYSGWSGFSSPLNNDALADSWRFSFGFGITPDYTGKFIKRIQYKTGFYTAKSEVLSGGSSLRETGGTFGLVFPFIFGRDRINSNDYLQINLMADVGTRQPVEKALIRETYYRLTFGLTLNGLWFKKRKFD
jgi:hypothetical protein